jgi:glycosyltransferase involved in cell wall biosynthesis
LGLQSIDRTANLLKSFAECDSRIRVISQENQGAAAARNTAIAHANAEWIAVMDAHDVMEPRRLERQVAFVQDNSDIAIASTLVTWINQEGHVLEVV